MSASNFVSGISDGQRWWMGVVEDRGTGQYSGKKDNAKTGKCKVRVYGMYDDMKVEDLPWAHVAMPTTSGSVSGVGASPTGLVEGSIVIGFFIDGPDGQEPVVTHSLPHVQYRKKDRGEQNIK